jgi:hypothetical protein
MAQLKNSLAKEGNPVAFEINEDSRVRWIGEYDITADELLSGEESQSDGSKTSAAIERLETLLRGCEIPCGQIYTTLFDMGISKRSVDRAKKKLEIKSIKHANSWYWSL